ncbi:MAG: hypothetical protein AAFZ17_14385 [Cyanobacteria bacterium J06650_10]
MVIAYCTVFCLTLSTVLSAFLKDADATGGIEAWLFIFLAATLWPITLPFIISSKLRAHQTKAKIAQLQSLSSSASSHSKEAVS